MYQSVSKESKESGKRFQVVLEEKHDMLASTRILQDKETGILYLFHAWGYAGGMVPLLDHEGKPMTDKIEHNE